MSLATSYSLTSDEPNLQIFNSNWTTLNKVAQDLPKIVEVFNIKDMRMLRAHGFLSRFRIYSDDNGVKYKYDGKQFFTFVNNQAKTYVIDKKFNPVEVFSYTELKRAISIL